MEAQDNVPDDARTNPDAEDTMRAIGCPEVTAKDFKQILTCKTRLICTEFSLKQNVRSVLMS
jgi:hypothetical protein